MPKKSATDLEQQLPVPVELIERRIYLIRGFKVMLDSDLAELYQVTTGNFNLAVRRNQKRFPEDFGFQLTKEETDSLLLQIARAKTGRGGRQLPRMPSPNWAWPCSPPFYGDPVEAEASDWFQVLTKKFRYQSTAFPVVDTAW